MKTFSLLCATLTAAVLPIASIAGCAGVQAPHCAHLVDVQILDRDTGQLLPQYRHDRELWVAGIPGHSYAIRLRNASMGRILGVVAVDGVNAVSGETAAWTQTGYVLSPWQSYDVLGWRKSPDHVADFVFTALEDSYAVRTGRPRDVGVIGLAIFREKEFAPSAALAEQAPAGKARALDGPSAAPATPDATLDSAARALSRQEPAHIGTGHGASETSSVGTTRFERAQDVPDLVISIRYDRPEMLAAMGITPDVSRPRPFPDSAALDFVPDPPARHR